MEERIFQIGVTGNDKRFAMRHCRWQIRLIVVCATAILLCLQSGCQLINRFRTDPLANVPVAFNDTPSKEQLLAHLAAQKSQIRQIQSDVRVSMDGLPTLRGTLAVEKPNRLRLTAGLLGVSELGVDVGSNAERFWFWTKVAAPGQEPGIYYADHAQYQNSNLHAAVPIEPSWLMDALGLVEFRHDDRIEGPIVRPDGMYEIRTYRSNRNIRVSVIDPKYGWVSQQAMYDGAGRLLAHADSIDYQHYPDQGVNLPGLIELTAYNPAGGKLEISVDPSNYKLNSIYGDPDKLWAMPNPGNVSLFNLVTQQRVSEPQMEIDKVSDGKSFDHRTSSGENRFQSFAGRTLR